MRISPFAASVCREPPANAKQNTAKEEKEIVRKMALFQLR